MTKIPLSVNCVEYSYDITEQQPQLFVAPNFEALGLILEELAETLAFRRGGTYGLEKAMEVQTINTVELNSGLQISGILTDIKKDKNGEAFYYRFSGPSQLSLQGQELNGHGKSYHMDGFSSPLGRLAKFPKPLSAWTASELKDFGLIEGQEVELEFTSGVFLKGQFVGELSVDQKLLLLTFKSCTVTLNDETLFDPSWGVFDMAVGEQVTSVFAGPADREAYGLSENFSQRRVPTKKLAPRQERLSQLYLALRTMRREDKLDLEQIQFIAKELTTDYPEQWLLRLEIVELLERGWIKDAALESKLRLELEKIKKEFPQHTQVIDDGLAIAGHIY